MAESYYPFLSAEEIQSFCSKHPNLKVVNTPIIEYLFTFLRNKETSTKDFRVYSHRIINILLEEAAGFQATFYTREKSPLSEFDSLKREKERFSALTILRAGNAFLLPLITLFPDISIGQILIQRDEHSEEKKPVFYYSKLAKNMKGRKVFVCDPMLGTGGSLEMALTKLFETEKELKQEDVTAICLIGNPAGTEKVLKAFPGVKLLLGALDPLIVPNTKYIAPGIGDFGDRYFGSEDTD